MALLLLVRHGLTDATGKRLYGRSPGVHLSDRGRRQVGRLAERLRAVPLAAVYASPLERCRETARALAEGRGLEVIEDPELTEVDAGEWTGRSFARLRLSPAWRELRGTPSAARFPGGESLAEVQARTVGALRSIASRHPGRTVAVVSHGDPIRLALAHFAGIHLDLFRRLDVATASVSAVALGDGDPRILRMSDTGTLDGLGAG